MLLPARAVQIVAALVFLSLLVPPQFPAMAAPTRAWVDGPTELLTLQQAIEMALSNNLDAQVDHASFRIADARVRQAWGDFDPVLAINTTREFNQVPQNPTTISSADVVAQQQQQQASFEQLNNLLGGVLGTLPPTSTTPYIFTQNSTRSGSNLQGKLPIGTTYQFKAEFDLLRSSIRNFDRQILPSNTGFVGLTLDQPLLRDFGFAANLAAVRLSRRDRTVAYNAWKQSVINSVGTVMTTYCDMVYALQAVRVREEAVEAGRRLVAGNQRRLDVGLMSPIDVRQAQVAMSEDQEQLLQTRNLFMEKQFALKRQILREFQSGEDRTYVPADDVGFVVPPLERTALLQDAFANRLDYLSSIETAERENVRLRYARNQLLPKLDLVGTLGLSGLSTQSGVTHSFENAGPAYALGVQASVPFGNVQARAQFDIARTQKEQAILKIKQAELTVSVDVDTIISRIHTAQQSMDTSRQSTRLAEEALRIQERRIEQGQVSSFDLIEIQKKLYEARVREIDARDALDKAVIQLYLATGTLLEERGIQFVDERDRRATRPAAAVAVAAVQQDSQTAPTAPRATPVNPLPSPQPQSSQASPATPQNSQPRRKAVVIFRQIAR